MDTVVFDGVEFVKASVLAKQFRYTSDYVGQLCRAKKVDARLVGRTWFVNPESVVAHKKNKKAKTASPTIVEEPVVTSEIKISRKIVTPVVQNKTVKVTNDLTVKQRTSDTRSLKVEYEPDDETLIPTLIRKVIKPPKTIRVEQANAKKVKVKAKKAEFSFKAGELPEVSLSGKLNITSYPDLEPEENSVKEEEVTGSQSESQIQEEESESKKISTEVSNSLKNIAISDKQDVSSDLQKDNKNKAESKLTTDILNKAPSVRTKKLIVEERDFIRKPKKRKSEAGVKDTLNKTVSVENPASANKKTKTIEEILSEPLIKSDLPVMQPEKKVSAVVLVSPLIATIIALVCVLFIFSASTKVDVFDYGYHSQIILQVANLLEIFRP